MIQSRLGRTGRTYLGGILAGLVLWAYLEAVQFVGDSGFHPLPSLMRGLFALPVLLGALSVGRVRVVRKTWLFPLEFCVLAAVAMAAFAAWRVTGNTFAAWIGVALFYILLLALAGVVHEANRWVRLVTWGGLAAAGGILPVAIDQFTAHFGEEEFFLALQAGLLSLFAAWAMVLHFGVVRWAVFAAPVAKKERLAVPVSGLLVIGGVLLLSLVGAGALIRVYQSSFYPAQAPSFPGISEQAPFLCGSGVADEATPGGQETFARLVARVAANEAQDASEYGFLALVTGERRWAEIFRQTILEEAQAGLYAGPAHSMKSIQYQAARRVYYLPRVVRAFPDLFSASEMELLDVWLADVNRRALTVEWVDWLYALALAERPHGPYENQENGAGLLALLETYGLGDGALSERNQLYLQQYRRGWFARFRNTDDAYLYQVQWLDNALFQAAYWQDRGEISPQEEQNQRLSFEWLLLQGLPDGAPLGYNHPVHAAFGPMAYLAARLLDDPRYVWWSARFADWAERNGAPFYARPGAENPITLQGVSPDVGSCLMYGGSGLPTQQGPLAPDKIVFRDGWTAESRYLLLNLRFSGWHRYKGTNAVVLFYQNEPLVVEQNVGASFDWLPEGRSIFRDKRIPRQNLNGLLIERSGMGAVLYGLTGIGSVWAEDPPPYAEVVAFETGTDLDRSHTRIRDWHGWQHDRIVYFYRPGPIVVVDTASGPPGMEAALTWHLTGGWSMKNEPGSLYHAGQDMAMRLLSPMNSTFEVTDEQGREPGLRLLYPNEGDGALQVVTLFLSAGWTDAEITPDWQNGTLEIVQGQERIVVPLPGLVDDTVR